MVNKTMKVIRNQDGAALLITIVVMLALTLLALASTNSNQNQAFMVRNAQFRFETFNASYSEIDAQIDTVNRRSLALGVPDYILYMIDNAIGTKTSAATTPALPHLAAAGTAYMEQSVEQEYKGACFVFDEQAGIGVEKIQCNELEIMSKSKMTDTQIESEQYQVYEYKTLAN